MGSGFYIVMGMVCGLLSARSEGSVLVALSTDSNAQENVSVRVSGPQQPAVSFTLPAQQYQVDSVTLNLRDYSSASDKPVIEFYSDRNGRPGTSLGSPLINPASQSNRSADFTFLPNGTLILQPGGTYWVMVSSAFGSFSWNAPNDLAWKSQSFLGTASFRSYKVGLNYGEFFAEDDPVPAFSISATAVPEPSVAALAVLGLLLTVGQFQRGR